MSDQYARIAGADGAVVSESAPRSVAMRNSGTGVMALAALVGNQSFGALVTWQGHSVPPRGADHHDMAMLAAQRGRKAPLTAAVRDEMAPALGDNVSDARVDTTAGAAALARAVSARVFDPLGSPSLR